MAEAQEDREQCSMRVNEFSRDVLHRFMNGKDFAERIREESNNGRKEEEELELSLGLSSNGKFGVDLKREKMMKLMRSSTVSHFMLSGEGSQARVVPIATCAPLTRTCSLPTETEEEWRKRKELQSLRRKETNMRRMEKLKCLRAGRDNVDSEVNSCEDNCSNIDSSGQDLVSNKASGNVNRMPSSQGSIGSQGSGSSGLSELGSQPIQVNKNNEARSPSSIHWQPLQNKQKHANSPAAVIEKSAMFLGADKGESESNDMIKNVMLDMPCVSTIGDGPNGKKIGGFLYRYWKEVRIVCVCHGSFLSPAEFVKHAGGGDVKHPLRHILVNSSPFS